mmetsp:Transcript_17060/g.40394  ORF Transcript_17060/g.40394 Transcript_17060/m.40394 type:complete len:122 (-) Transcript_17060:7-372(-)
MASGVRWPPRVAFHREFEWEARELEVFLDRPRASRCSPSPLRPRLLEVEPLNNYAEHGWSLYKETPWIFRQPRRQQPFSSSAVRCLPELGHSSTRAQGQGRVGQAGDSSTKSLHLPVLVAR